MATIYSDGFTKVRAGRELQANEARGKARLLQWDFASLPVGAIGDVLVCGILPARARIIQGREFHSAMGGTATGAYSTFGIASDGLTLGAIITAGKYLAAITFVAAGQNEIASTLAQNALVEESTDVLLCCVNASTAFATAGRVAGYVLYVQD
ncbi:MAG: hypothetical protein ACREB5_12025 [Sphingomonadaceae bacterium]